MATSGNAISRHLAAKKNGAPWIGDVPHFPNHRFGQKATAEGTLRRSEDSLQQLAEAFRDSAIFALDSGGRVTTWNHGAERVNGYNESEIIGQHFSHLYETDGLDHIKTEQELEVATSRGRFEGEGWFLRKNGSKFWSRVVIMSILDDNLQLSGFSVVLHDLTEQKQVEQELQRGRNQLRLLDLGNALALNRDFNELLHAVAIGIRSVIQPDATVLSLLEPDVTNIRDCAVDFAKGKGLLKVGRCYPSEASIAEYALRERKPFSFSGLPDWLSPDAKGVMAGEELKSGCVVPLLHGDRTLGTLSLFSFTENAFRQADVELLGPVSQLVATTVESSADGYGDAESGKGRAEQKIYFEDDVCPDSRLGELVGNSPAWKRVLERVATVAPTDATVLILGETGTGKDLVAQAIHNLSPRRERRFVRADCAAVPVSLLESELFGHEKGAFTGATTVQIGRFELADKGTFFLDEVGDIPLELQAKLLRVLEAREFERLGSVRTVGVDCRLVAATHRNLTQMIQDQKFRGDLYYRLNVFPVFLPPLRERREDIPLLVRHFVGYYAKRMNKRIDAIAANAMEAITAYDWPGNVRELRNLIERAVISSSGTVLRVPVADLRESTVSGSAVAVTLEQAEHDHILQALKKADWVVGGPHGAAAVLGLRRTTLLYKMQRLGISRSGTEGSISIS